MASVSLTMDGNTIGEVTTTFTIPDSDALRILQWAAAAYPKVVDGEVVQGTPAEYIDAVASATLKGIMANVVSHEKALAIKAAEESVADLQAEKA